MAPLQRTCPTLKSRPCSVIKKKKLNIIETDMRLNKRAVYWYRACRLRCTLAYISLREDLAFFPVCFVLDTTAQNPVAKLRTSIDRLVFRQLEKVIDFIDHLIRGIDEMFDLGDQGMRVKDKTRDTEWQLVSFE